LSLGRVTGLSQLPVNHITAKNTARPVEITGNQVLRVFILLIV
jgi:hypothetical protein